MITIDQLLESVDLDFEPRFVTKDAGGVISIWGSKPKQYIRQKYWASSHFNVNMESFGSLKLAEFANKPWTECIYEVPRKTTGKIEKMLEQKLTIGKFKYEYPTRAMLMDKINELVDAVNELMGNKHPTSTPQVPHKQKRNQ